MEIEIVEKNDLEGAMIVEGLTEKIFPEFVKWHRNSVLNYLRLGGKVFVAKISGEVVGFAFFRKIHEKLWELTLIGVLEEYRGMGIGGRLLEEAMKVIGGEIYLHVQTSNLPAIRLYEKFGFVKDKLIRGFYSDGSDAYLMVRRDFISNSFKP
jgi:ribosomal protein S18 acetylase RimI-like enzyme